jgi:hypothetical protein
MRVLLPLAMLAALTACGKKEAKAPPGASFGQVLPGSASDAMLPYDTASSTPPPAPETYDAADDSPSRPEGPRGAEAGEVAPEAEAT